MRTTAPRMRSNIVNRRSASCAAVNEQAIGVSIICTVQNSKSSSHREDFLATWIGGHVVDSIVVSWVELRLRSFLSLIDVCIPVSILWIMTAK